MTVVVEVVTVVWTGVATAGAVGAALEDLRVHGRGDHGRRGFLGRVDVGRGQLPGAAGGVT